MIAPRCLLAAMLTAAAGFSGSIDSNRAERLQPDIASGTLFEGATIERPATPGAVHRYEAWLTAGDFVDIDVSQDQIRAALSARGPDEDVLHHVVLPDIDPIAARLMFIAPVSGRYAVELTFRPRPIGLTDAAYERKQTSEPDRSTYTMRVVALRPATPDDGARTGWFGLVERADALIRLQRLDALRQAFPLLREAAAGWRSIRDGALEAMTLELLAQMTGIFTQFSHDTMAARERLTELHDGTGARHLALLNWHRLAAKYFQEGRLADAKRAEAHALELALALGFRSAAANSRRDLGFFELELGNYEQARALAEQARTLAAEIPDVAIEALAEWTLARLDELAGDLEAAIARNRRARDLAASTTYQSGLITMSLGFNYLSRGDLDQAAEQFEARLALARVTVQRDQEALTRLGLGDVLLARGDRDGARQRYEAAAAELQKGSQAMRCIAEQRLGRVALADDRLELARTRFETMLEIARQRQQPICEAEARAGLADVAARGNDFEAADADARRVVELTESFREAALSHESRSLGFGALAPAYERAIDISMRRAAHGDDAAIARALALNEQALARGLLDRVLEQRLDASARVPPALATERQQTREQWRARLAELQVALRVRPDAPETKALVTETSALAVRVRDLDARIDAADARHAAFVKHRPLGVEGIQALLDEETVLLEYALGDARSYLWLVSAHDVRAFTLPSRATIEALARRVHDGLARSPAAADALSSERRTHQEDRRALTRLVIEPAASLLAGKRLVVVLPGALSLVPFGALLQPDGAADRLLILRHEIVQVPSATLLGAMRVLTAGRARPSKTAAIFADPIFDAADPRIGATPALSARRAAAPAPSALRLPGLSLSRLPFSRDEAQAIASLAPGKTVTFLGSEAARERAVERALFDYRFIHFATHGVVNQEMPSLSSLVLSLVDRAGRPRDGLVMVPDIYEMTLNADVVVLSGCQTALGKHIRGEGPIGLARAFMYAGVPRVVGSLWPVDDLATAELMKRFYRGMLIDRLTPAAALRAAQRALAESSRWRSPYYWASFVLQGDWR